MREAFGECRDGRSVSQSPRGTSGKVGHGLGHGQRVRTRCANLGDELVLMEMFGDSDNGSEDAEEWSAGFGDVGPRRVIEFGS